jgi:uncharacterized protein YggE
LSFSDFAQCAGKNFIDQNYIEVTGKAEMRVTPDLIHLKIVLKETNRVSIVELEKKMSEKLQQMEIDVKKDLSVFDQLSRYRSKFLSKAEVVLTKEYQLTLHDAKTASKVFSELEEADISNVSVVRLDHSKMEEFRRDVKINAIKAAKDKAEYLTKAVSQNIGRAIFIQEINAYPIDLRENSNTVLQDYYSGADKIGGGLDIDFEKIKVEHSILVRFELK